MPTTEPPNLLTADQLPVDQRISSAVDPLEGLNDAQRSVVTHDGGPLLVVAGAGSGKTRTLTRRYMWLIQNGVPVEEILALTFTNDAADELKGRIEDSMLGQLHSEIQAMTVHALCIKFLEEEHEAAGISPFVTPATDSDRLAIMLGRFNELEIAHHDIRGNPAKLLNDMLGRIQKLKEQIVTPEAFVAWAESQVAGATSEEELSAAQRDLEFGHIFALHDQFLHEAGLLDFAGMQIELVRIMEEKPYIRERLARHFTHIMVDEFQDTNYVQGRIIELLAQDHRNLVVVGDDDQSIYGFRGSTRETLTEFEQRYPDAKRIALEINYRSCPEIVIAARAVVAPDPDRLPKTLRAHSTASGTVNFWQCEDDRAQADAIAAEAARLIAEEGANPAEIAILLGSVRHDGSQIGPIVAALDRRGVPYYIASGKAFFERSEIRDVIAWLTLLTDPNHYISATRALLRQPVGLTASDLAFVIKATKSNKLESLVSALPGVARDKRCDETLRRRIGRFNTLYDKALTAMDELAPQQFVERLIDRLGLRGQQLYVTDMVGSERLRNLSKLEDMAIAYQRTRPTALAREFAVYAAAIADSGAREDEEPPSAAPIAIRILTRHGCKGLEFDHVFVPNLTHGSLPGSRKKQSGDMPIAAALLRQALPDTSREAFEAEKRRELHVAMTRARHSLTLSWHTQTAGNKKANKPSAYYIEALEAVEGQEQFQSRALFGATNDLYPIFAELRDRVIVGSRSAALQLAEPTLDAHTGTAQAVAAYMELVKLAALIDRSEHGESVSDCLPEINAALLQGMSTDQRTEFEKSPLDDRLLATEQASDAQRVALSQPSLAAFLPRVGEDLKLSATDIDTYESCPLRYQYSKVVRVPTERTLNMRFGTTMHSVLERFHETAPINGETLQQSKARISELYEHAWRRGGYGVTTDDMQYYEKGRVALDAYSERFAADDAVPERMEVSFKFAVGKAIIAGRIDRIDRLPDGTAQLVDYKTGAAKKASDLKDDIQLSLYRLAARESLGLDATQSVYWYLNADKKVQVDHSDEQIERVEATIERVSEGILAQNFEPTPSYQTCKFCDFRGLCPAVEK